MMKLFHPDSFGGGGSFFTDGKYRIEKAIFTKYDFGGKAGGKDGDGIPSLCLKLQPLDKDGKDAGEEKTQYWSAGEDFTVENKGKGLELRDDASNSTFWKLSDYGVFIDYLGKAGFDRDTEEEDITILNGVVAEFSKINSPRAGAKKEGKDGKELPQQVIVITEIVKSKKGGSGSKSTDTKKSDSKKESEGADNGSDTQDPEELAANYMTDKVLVSKNEKGINRLNALMGVNGYVKEKGGNADLQRKAHEALKANLEPLCESAGWKINGQMIVKAKE